MNTINTGIRVGGGRAGAIALFVGGVTTMAIAAAAWVFFVKNAPEPPPTAGAPLASQEASPEPPRVSKPSYVMKEGREYGYEPAPTLEERQRGMAASTVMMYRFLGRVGDKYQVGVRDGGSTAIAEAAPPFEFAKVYTFAGDELVATDTMHLRPNAILALVLNDAMHGDLEQYRGLRNGKYGHLMLDTRARRILFVADN